LVAAPDLGSGAERRGGSSPFIRTKLSVLSRHTFMQVTQEKVNDLNAIIHIEFKSEDYKPQVEKTLKDYSKKASMPGFRPGKVPASLVKKMYGQSVFVDELNKLTSETLYNYLKDNQIDVLGNPLPLPINDFSIDVEPTEPIKLAFEIGISPQFDLKLNKETQFTLLTVEPQEEDLEKTIVDYQKRLGTSKVASVISNDSILTLTIFPQNQASEESADGNTISTEFKLLSDKIQSLIQNLSVDNRFDALAGELFTRAEDSNQKLKGISPETPLTIEIKKIEEIELAEVNQEFFDKIFGESNVTSLDEMKDRISEDTSKHYLKDSEERFYNEVIEHLIKEIKFELPDSFLQRWLLSVNTDKVSPEDIENNYTSYEKGIRWQLIENKLIVDNGIQVTFEGAVESLKGDFLAYFGAQADDEEISKRAQEIAINMLKDEKERDRVFDKLQKQAIIELFKNSFTLIQERLAFEKWVEAMNKPFA